MPQIPFFPTDQLVAPEPAGPTADPRLFAGPAQALAGGAAEVSDVAANFEQRYADMRRQVDASALTTTAAKQAEDLYFKQSKIPDAAAAQQGFDAGFAQIRKATLAGVSDPAMLASVQTRLDQIGQNLSTQTHATAFQQYEVPAQVGKLQLDQAALLPRIAAAPNALYRQQLIDGHLASIQKALSTGLINGETAARMQIGFKSDVAEADAWKDATVDPIATAKRLQDPSSYPGMSQDAKGRMLWHVMPRADAAQVKTWGASLVPEVVSVPPRFNAVLDNAIAGTPVPRIVAAAVFQHESGWDPNAVSDTGAVGLGQILPSTARAPGFGVTPVDPARLTDPATNATLSVAYLTALGRKHGVTDWNNPEQLRGVLQDYNGGAQKAQYAQDVLDLMRAPPAQGPPDEAAIMRRAEDMTRDQPQLQDRLLAEVQKRLNFNRASTAVARSGLERDLRDLQPALLAGQDVAIPADRIHALLPPDQAADVMRTLSVAAIGGQVLKGLQFATPDQVAQAQTDLMQGLGATSTLLRLRLAKAGIEPGGANGAPETPEAFRIRTTLADLVGKELLARQTALTNDPASYVAQHPLVAAAAQAINPDDPASFQHYADATLAVQAQLGVAPENRRVLATGQSRAIAASLVGADPAKVDVGAALDGMEKQYQTAWGPVWHDLVRDGHMPATWQALAPMAPGVDRTALQQALRFADDKGGAEKLRAELDPAAALTIDRALPGALADMRTTLMADGARNGADAYGAALSAVRTLAQWKTLHGTDAGQAVDEAARAVLPYDYDGLTRAPRGQMDDASAYAASIQAAVKGSDLGPIDLGKGILAAAGADAYAARLRAKGRWVMNEPGDGWQLAMQGTDGVWQYAKRADGTPIGFRFDGIPHGAAAARASAPPVIEGGGF